MEQNIIAIRNKHATLTFHGLLTMKIASLFNKTYSILRYLRSKSVDIRSNKSMYVNINERCKTEKTKLNGTIAINTILVGRKIN